MGVGGGGVDDLEDPLAQDPQVLWRRGRWLGRAATARPWVRPRPRRPRAARRPPARSPRPGRPAPRPAASARRTGSCWSVSRAWASLRSRCAAARVGLVWWAHQFAVLVAPDSSPTRLVSAWAATRSFSSATRASAGSARAVSTGFPRRSSTTWTGRPASSSSSCDLGSSDRDRVSPMPGRCGAGHGSIQALDHRQFGVGFLCITGVCGHGPVTEFGDCPQASFPLYYRGFEARPRAASHLNHRAPPSARARPQVGVVPIGANLRPEAGLSRARSGEANP